VNDCFPLGKLAVPERDRHHHQRRLYSRHVVSEIKTEIQQQGLTLHRHTIWRRNDKFNESAVSGCKQGLKGKECPGQPEHQKRFSSQSPECKTYTLN